MIDLQLTKQGDLEITDEADVKITNSVCQAVRIRLLWFLEEWRLSPEMGFPYFEEVFVKNPSETKIRYLSRKTIMEVEEVTDVKSIDYNLDSKSRAATIIVVFETDEDTFREEVSIEWQNMV